MSENLSGFELVERLIAARSGPNIVGPQDNLAEGVLLEAFRAGVRSGRMARENELRERQDAARRSGFDSGANHALRWMLLELSGIAGELYSKRQPKVMVDAAIARCDQAARQIGQAVAVVGVEPMEGRGNTGQTQMAVPSR